MKRKLIVSLALVVALVTAGSLHSYTLEASSTQVEVVSQPVKVEDIQAKIHFINTGQSDCILVEDSGEFILIDGGDRDDDATVKAYLEKVGVKKLKFLVVTHYHSDHFGGINDTISSYGKGAEAVLVPNGDADTQVYRDFINSCMSVGLKPSVPLPDSKFTLGNSTFKFYNTKGGYDNTNNNSLVVELTSGKTKALFMGDAEKEVEQAILKEVGDVDILKVGHHGSHSSSTPEFLDKVKPEVAVIQVEKGNKYGHPHKETMSEFKTRNIEVHRNDECGDIVYTITKDGYTTECKVKGSYNPGNKDATTETKPSTNGTVVSKPQEPAKDSGSTKKYYWTPSGKSYHTTKRCSTLSRSKTILEGTLKESRKSDPCDRCH